MWWLANSSWLSGVPRLSRAEGTINWRPLKYIEDGLMKINLLSVIMHPKRLLTYDALSLFLSWIEGFAAS